MSTFAHDVNGVLVCKKASINPERNGDAAAHYDIIILCNNTFIKISTLKDGGTIMGIQGNYVREASADFIRFALFLRGIAFPEGKLSCLELECGHSLTPLFHSAASGHAITATESNADNAVKAQNLAKSCGIDVEYKNISLAEFTRTEAGKQDGREMYDIIVVNDLWSYCPEEARVYICRIVNDSLKTGGALFISYKALPGWASLMPLRTMLQVYAGTFGGMSLQERFRASLQVVLEQVKHGGFFDITPTARKQLELLCQHVTEDMAREWLNPHWRPFYSADMQQILSRARLQFATSANLLRQVDAITLPRSLEEALGKDATSLQREMARDVACNAMQRSDIFVKGAHRLSLPEMFERQKHVHVCLMCTPEEIPQTLEGIRGKISLNSDIYSACIRALASNNYTPKSFEELEDFPSLEAVDTNQIMEVLTVLAGMGAIFPVNEHSEADIAQCTALNTALCKQARTSGATPWLLSPVAACGISVPRMEQLFLLSRMNRGDDVNAWAEDTYNILSGAGEALFTDNGTPVSSEDSIKAIQAMAQHFADRRLPFLDALGVRLTTN